MHTLIDINDVEVLKTGNLAKMGEQYSLVLLSVKNIDQIMALQDIAFKDLSEQEQTYLLRKERNFFENHFSTGNAVLGIVHGNRLISQSVIVNPTSKNPETGIPDMKLEAVIDKVTVLQGVIVDPAYRGNRLMSVMVDEWLAITQEKGRTHALSEVALDNSYSWAVFIKSGMHIERISVDPIDNSEVYTLHGHTPLKEAFTKASAKKKGIVAPHKDVKRQKELLSCGYRGVEFNPANGNLKFHRVKKSSPCL